MKRIIALISLAVLCFGIASSGAAEVDQIISDFKAMRGMIPLSTQIDTTILPRCGMSHSLDLINVKEEIGDVMFKQLVIRPVGQATHETQHFVIHYYTSTDSVVYQVGVDVNPANGVPDFVDSVGFILEYIWSIEVDSLQYPAPPEDGSAGGNSLYDVYLVELDPRYYGYTVPETQLDSRRYTSYIVLDNDYQEQAAYRDRPLEAIKVTAAHEFFHAIHYNLDSYEYDVVNSQAKPWWYEVTSTWMEDIVYNNINDYRNYLRFFFDYPWIGLGEFSTDPYDPVGIMHPYASCVWARFLEDRFNRDVIRQIWLECAAIGGYNLLPATDNVLLQEGSSFDAAFREFTSWNFFTGNRADTVHKYKEANYWPKIKPRFSTMAAVYQYPDTGIGGTYTVAQDSVPQPLAANYLIYEVPSHYGDGGLRFTFNGDDFSGKTWDVGVLGWSPATDTLLNMSTTPNTGEGMLGFCDWWRFDSLIMIPSVFSQSPGYSSYGYTFHGIYEESLSCDAPRFDSLTTEVTIIAGSCADVPLHATSPLADSMRLFTPDSLLAGLTLTDNHDGTGMLRYCPDLTLAGKIVPINVYVANSAGFNAQQISFIVLPSVTNVYADIYPNPVKYPVDLPVTLRYFLPDTVGRDEIDIRIFGVAGDLIKEFPKADIQEFNTGFHLISWDGNNDQGKSLAGGIYFIKIRAGNKSGSGKFAIIR